MVTMVTTPGSNFICWKCLNSRILRHRTKKIFFSIYTDFDNIHMSDILFKNDL